MIKWMHFFFFIEFDGDNSIINNLSFQNFNKKFKLKVSTIKIGYISSFSSLKF